MPFPIKPKSCDICKDPIGLYQPWYSIRMHGFLTFVKDVPDNPMTFCPRCFQAYKDFLVEREVQENHRRNYGELIRESGK